MNRKTNNFTFDTKDFAVKWYKLGRGWREPDPSCASAIEKAVEGFYDWTSFVTHPLHHHVTDGADFSPELANTPAAKAAAAKCMSGILKTKGCNVDLRQMFSHMLQEIFTQDSEWSTQWGSIQAAIIKTFYDIFIEKQYSRFGVLDAESMSQRGKMEAMKWDSRQAADSAVWGNEPYTEDVQQDGGLAKIQESLKRRLDTDGSQAVPVSRELFATVAKDVPFNKTTVVNMMDNARDELPQAPAAHEWLLNRATGDEALSLDDTTLSKLMGMILSIRDTPYGGHMSPLLRRRGSYGSDESPFIKLLRRIFSERPRVAAANGGELMRRLWEVAHAKESDTRMLSYGSFEKIRQELNKDMNFYPDELRDLQLLMLELPNIMTGSENAKTFCARFKKMESLPPDIRSKLLGRMMMHPTMYDMSISHNPLTRHITDELLRGTAHAHESDDGCLIVLNDGTTVKLGPRSGEGNQ